MGMKFLNKKGWHTGSLRNIENVWKAEQKNELEKKKLEELRKQIQEEKERSEFRRLQEQAGLIPRQERLEFLYDSGLSVGKPSSDSSFKSLESLPQPSTNNNNEVGGSSSAKQDSVPGALFEEKQQSANDSWRKLHSDPLLMIRQREQEALARIKNNPVKMAMIRKSVEAKKHDESENKKAKRKHKKRSSKNRSDSEDEDRKHKKRSSSKHRIESENDGGRHKKHSSSKYPSDSEDHKNNYSSKHRIDSEDDGRRRLKKYSSSKYPSDSEDEDMKHKNNPSSKYRIDTEDQDRRYRKHASSKHQSDSDEQINKEGNHRSSNHTGRQQNLPNAESQRQRRISDDKDKAVSGYRRRNVAPKLSEEERAAKLREMQMDAELHEDQRWRRLKKADENDAKEAIKSATAKGKSFLDAAQESVYGAEQGGNATIEDSVRRRSHFRQSRSAAEGNAFRR